MTPARSKTAMSPSNADDNPTPPATGGLPGTILVRVVVPLWVVAGGAVKLGTFNPALLPEPILDLVRSSAGVLGIENLGWWLEMSLRFFVAVEFAAAIVMVAAPRFARFTASFLLTVFLAVLVATMAMSARRDGISAIWSGSCGCFGSASPPPIGMFALDLALLLGVVFLRPRSSPATPWRFWVLPLAIVLGFGIAYGRPKPVIVIEIEPEPTPQVVEATRVETAPADWGDIPTEVEPFYAPDFATWVGTTLVEHELARLISRPLPDWIETGRFHLVLHRADCDHCHELLEVHFGGELQTPVIAVEIPDTDPASALPMPCLDCRLHRLPEGPNYVLTTPVLMTVENGRVLGVCEGSDPAEIVATIDARPST